MRRPWDGHPPWVHPSFFWIGLIAGTLGPIGLIVSVVSGHGRRWWLWAALCAVWVIDLLIDWLLVQRIKSRDPEWEPWQPPSWSR
jgi:hypothetical protein